MQFLEKLSALVDFDRSSKHGSSAFFFNIFKKIHQKMKSLNS